ncbi:hypothetical protein IQ277_16245 [Nostocales cyanobacterium LEGE 12452]|nr:hypothetical protein [Nostocales cyanobacterium LEGE 12452]
MFAVGDGLLPEPALKPRSPTKLKILITAFSVTNNFNVLAIILKLR